MTTEEMAALLWRIYLESCVCHLDYHSPCNCPATDIAAEALSDLLGPEWHEIMRSKS